MPDNGMAAIQDDLERLVKDIAASPFPEPLATTLQTDVKTLQVDVGHLQLQADVDALRADVEELQKATVPHVGSTSEKIKALGLKMFRTFIATFASTWILTVLPVVEDLAKGNGSFGAVRGVAVAAVVGAGAAAIRAAIALLPLFKADDDTGIPRSK